MKLTKIIARDLPYVGGFILFETLTLVSSGNAHKMQYAPLFYTFDILYFYCMAIYILPKQVKGARQYLLKAFLVTSLIILLATLRLLLFAVIGNWSSVLAVLTSRIVITTMLYRALIITGYAGAYWMGMDRAIKANKLKHQVQEMENKRVILENTNLLVQIDRHTQLNVFNKLYSLVMPHSERAARLVLVLSEQEQLSLQNIDETGKIPLAQEIEFLENMIRLEQISSEQPLYIRLEIKATDQNHYLRIPPKLLTPLLENIFKHGITDEADYPALVILSVGGDQLIVDTRNSKLPQRDLPSYNIGLANIKNRLRNFYPDAHELKITETDNTFHLQLKIRL